MPTTFEPDDSQARALPPLCEAPFCLITGGPGTANPTSSSRATFGPDRAQIELAAPTGKAAKRMTEATGRDARTLHRLLQYHPVAGFTRNAEQPIEADLVIVDEASMLDVELAAALFDAVRGRTRLALVGDANQLPPVGPGQVFADLIAAPEVPSVRLEHVHRSAAESWVNRNAPRVLAGQPLELDPTHDFQYVRVASAADVLPALREVCEADVSAQVLIPQRPGVAGIYRANDALQAAFNPPSGEREPVLQREHYSIRANDRVLQTRNDYALGVFNGDVGEVTGITADAVGVLFPGQQVEYTRDAARALDLAYALTVHRSQGSEFDHVVCVVHSAHHFVLSRALLYTAITHTRKRVTIVGDDRGLHAALHSVRKELRNTTLVERMRGQLEEVAAC